MSYYPTPEQRSRLVVGLRTLAEFFELAVVGIMAISAGVLFTILMIGIRRGDRRHLMNAPQSNSGAPARRKLVGVRYLAEHAEGADE